MKIVHHQANGRVDRLISGHQSVNPSREAISILSGKYKRFLFVHLVSSNTFKVGSHDPFFASNYSSGFVSAGNCLIEMLICVINFFEFE